mmetsp:Transcript_14559/g.38808  ORF Transcript_14559/g.38808 Transcript_14559/m.38808 type:complete len:204 (+) Transcript_14559:95-706(+)
MDHFHTAWESFNAARRSPRGGACFIHCQEGVNRSGALACAILMRVAREEEGVAADACFWASWSSMCRQRGGGRGVVSNLAFQRQLLLFARLGCRWWPELASLCGLWRTPLERSMAAFRAFVADLSWQNVVGFPGARVEHHRLLAMLVRDGVMRKESGLAPEVAYNLSPENGAQAQAEARVRDYANAYLPKKVRTLEQDVVDVS